MGGGKKRRNNFSNSGPTRKSPRGRADSNPNWRQSEPSTSTGRGGGRGQQPQNGGNRNFSNRQQSDSGNESEPSISAAARPSSNSKNSGGVTTEQTQVKKIRFYEERQDWK